MAVRLLTVLELVRLLHLLLVELPRNSTKEGASRSGGAAGPIVEIYKDYAN